MKKLLSVVAVAAIVTSAFAFTNKNKTMTYCVRNAAGNACQCIMDKMVVNGTPNFKHWPLAAGYWDGTCVTCENASPVNDCKIDIRLINN